MSAKGEPAVHPSDIGPWALGAVAIFLWGATPAATKIAVADIDGLVVGMLRTVLAGCAVLPALLLGRPGLPRDRQGLMLLSCSAICGFVAFPLLFSLSLVHTSTAHVALIIASAPILTSLIGAAVERRLPPARWWAGMAVAMAGEVLLIRSGNPQGGEAALQGDLLALAACVAVAAGYVAGSRLAVRTGAWNVTVWGVLIGAVLLFPLLAATGLGHGGASPTGESLAATVYLAVFSSVLAYAAWYRALASGGVTRLAPLQFLQPLVTLLLAVVLFGEALTVPLLAAGVLVLAGVAMARSA